MTKLLKSERRNIVLDYVKAVNDVDGLGVNPESCSMNVCRMINVDSKLIASDVRNLTQQGKLVFRDRLLWFAKVVE